MTEFSTDFLRHLRDLWSRTYEGAEGRPDRERVFAAAFDLVTPIALRVLEDINAACLYGTGTTNVRVPVSAADGSLTGAWLLWWPRLREQRTKNGTPLPHVEIHAFFPHWFTHAHLALRASTGDRQVVAAWPLQVQSSTDAERQRSILEAIALAELHDRIYQAGIEATTRRPLVLWDEQ